MNRVVKALMGIVLFQSLMVSAQAADLADKPKKAKAPVAAAAPAPAIEQVSPWMIRVRAIGVLPSESAKLFAGGAQVDASAKITNSVVPEIDVSYFFTKNFAVEAICCLTPHSIKGTGAIANQGKIGNTILLPPTVLAQYHFTDFGKFKPYAGVGLNYTHYFNNGEGPNYSSLKIKDSWGVAGQIGFDYMLDSHWGINVDVKKIVMQPNATVVLAGTTDVSAKVKINPWIIGTGVTYRF